MQKKIPVRAWLGLGLGTISHTEGLGIEVWGFKVYGVQEVEFGLMQGLEFAVRGSVGLKIPIL